MKKIWVNKARSFKEAEKFDIRYYMAMSAAKRLETMQVLREIYGKLKYGKRYKNRRRLQRVVKIIQ